MVLKNIYKVIKLYLTGGALAKGKLKYKLTGSDLLMKLFTSKSKFNINCVMCGYPRSGTHWIRNVIEKSSGLYCPNIEDIEYDKVFENKTLPIIKIHARSKIVLKLKMLFTLPPHSFNKKYIYVYRDPRDAIISLYNMYNILQNKNLSQKEFLEIYDPIGQFKWEINSWVLNKKENNILIIKFEDLKKNTLSTFECILKFLNIESGINSNTLNEYVGVVEDNKRKKGVIYGWKNTYEDYKYLIDEINKNLEKEIVSLNYDI
jgi:hypothetical protein